MQAEIRHLLLTFFIIFLLFQLSSQGAMNRKRRQTNIGYRRRGAYTTSLYSSHSSSYNRYRGPNPARPTTKRLEQNLDKSKLRTGRYCAYPTYKLVPHSFINGTQTYLKRVVKHCPWSALYCNPTVSYVTETRPNYSTRMKQVATNELRCCPGFSGPKCDKVCYNCSVVDSLRSKVETLSQMFSNGDFNVPVPNNTVNNIEGPPGPPGPRGEPGTQGPSGDQGEPGAPGIPGARGQTGLKGDQGLNGLKGDQGLSGLQGLKGETGLSGKDGKQGEPGMPGIRGEPGRDGMPGPPGVCSCPTTSTMAPEAPSSVHGPETTPELNPGPETTPGPSSNTCMFKGTLYQNDELWKTSDCEECLCLDGTHQCFEILCPPKLSCKYTYKPQGYCCEVCCESQEDPVSEGSGDTSGDGASETIPSTTLPPITSPNGDVTKPGSYYEYPDEDEYDNYSDESDLYSTRSFKSNGGCPVLESRSFVSHDGVSRVCRLPRETGPCRARMPRVYYDHRQGRCRAFTYGGCEGNANNFRNMRSCEKLCLHNPDDVIETDSSDDDYPFHKQPRRCQQPKVVGVCKATLPRFYYDKVERVCKLFYYGGCGGNRNKFMNPWACKDICGGDHPVFTIEPAELRGGLPQKCYLPKKIGPCRGSLPRFYYNQYTKKCQIFTFGGCSENGNNFEYPDECVAACKGEISYVYESKNSGSRRKNLNVRNRAAVLSDHPERCRLPIDEGPCNSKLYRYYYDVDTQLCSLFVYSGCRGNGNRFMTPEDCKNECDSIGFNFTITLAKDITDSTQLSIPFSDPVVGTKGDQGPPGPAGAPGPPGKSVVGPRGPPGRLGEAVSINDENEISELKSTVETLEARIFLLEQQILTLVQQDDSNLRGPFAEPLLASDETISI